MSCFLDPLLVDKVRDVVGSHLNPLHKAVVFCVDEKSHQSVLPMRGLDSWSCDTVDANANAPEALDVRGYPAMRKSDTPRERITRDHRFSLDHKVLR